MKNLSILVDSWTQKFFLFFVSLLTIPNVKTDIVLDENHFIFLEEHHTATLKVFKYQNCTPVKSSKKSYQTRQTSALLCNSIALIYDWNCVKSLQVTKIVRELVWVIIKNIFPKTFCKIFLLLFMFVLTIQNVKTVIVWLKSTFLRKIFLRKRSRPKIKVFQYQIFTSVKSFKTCDNANFNIKVSNFKCWYFWTCFKSVALIFGLNCVKGLKVTKIVRRIVFEEVLGKLLIYENTIFKDNSGQNIWDKL